MAWIALFVVVASLARAAREMAIAYRYGVSVNVDAFLFVFNLVSWPIAVWLSVLSIVLVPIAAQLGRSDPSALRRFRAELLGNTLAVGTLLALAAWAVLPTLLRSSWVGLPPATADIAVGTSAALALLLPLGFAIGLLSVWMMAESRHSNSAFEAIPAGYIPLIVQDTLEAEGCNGFHRTRDDDTPYILVPFGPAWSLSACPLPVPLASFGRLPARPGS